MLAGGIHETDTVLEPSAGRGALIKRFTGRARQ